MMQRAVLLGLGLSLSLLSFGQNKGKTVITTTFVTPASDSIKPRKPVWPLADKTKSSHRTEGLFTLYQDTTTGSVQIYIRKDQLGKEFIYQSFSLNGPTALFLNQSMHRANFIFKVQKSFDKLEFSRVNTSFYYDSTNAISRSKDVDKPEAIMIVEKISGEDSAGYLINADGLFITERLDPVKPVSAPSFFSMPTFNLGGLNPFKSKYAAVRSFPSNTDIIVDLAYDNPGAVVSGGPDITDPRYVRVRMQHSFIALPQNDFQPRRDDPRVGFFGQQVTDQTSISATPYRDIIHRWNLKKKDPDAVLSEPVEPIVYWVENTTPVEWRQTILEAGLQWNKAFEKAGFKNAVQMKLMPDDAAWDPADLRYNVIRWVSSANPPYGAIGPSIVNPRTGQILGADITIEWSFVSGAPVYDELFNGHKKQTLSLPGLPDHDYTNCSMSTELVSNFLLGTTALELAAGSNDLKELHRQFLTWAVMHEMGHTLGLTHNMKASHMLSPAEINNRIITKELGLSGSVMDYTAINIAADPKKQGDYYSTITGPYDNWAIEYGYSAFSKEKEEAELKRILARSTDPKLAFGNDGDDMRSPGKGMDPRVNVWDLTNDPISYAEQRFQVVNGLMGKLLQKYKKEGQSFAELRSRFNALQGQRLNMISVVSRYIGGVYVDRSFPEQKSEAKPFTPVSISQQKKAINLLNRYVFAPDAYAADATLYAYLQPQRRLFNQAGFGDDYKITSVMLNNQVGGALAHILHPATLQRMTNSSMYGNAYSVADMLSDLSSSIFSADIKSHVNVQRQYLQTAFVRSLLNVADLKTPFFDDVAKAAALYTLRNIRSQMSTAISPNAETKAHRSGLVYLIDMGLENK
jgi:hypothetical protein